MSTGIEARLRGKQAELSRRITAIEDELRHKMDDDFAEQAVDRADDEPLDAIEQELRKEMAAIEGALARLKSGDYGRCTACGELIATARLEVLPTASLCIACATRPA